MVIGMTRELKNSLLHMLYMLTDMNSLTREISGFTFFTLLLEIRCFVASWYMTTITLPSGNKN